MCQHQHHDLNNLHLDIPTEVDRTTLQPAVDRAARKHGLTTAWHDDHVHISGFRKLRPDQRNRAYNAVLACFPAPAAPTQGEVQEPATSQPELPERSLRRARRTAVA